jgi:hypothetical protein
MRKNKTLPAVRVSSNQYSEMKQAIEKLNTNNILELNESDFRRLCYKVFCDMVKANEKIKIHFICTKKDLLIILMGLFKQTVSGISKNA